MDPVEEILSLLALATRTAEQEARLNELFATLSDEEIGTLSVGATDLFDELRAGLAEAEDADAVIAQLSFIADVVDGTFAVAGERITAAEEQAAADAQAAQERADALAALEGRVHQPEPAAEVVEPEPAPAPAAAEVVEPEVVEPEPEPELVTAAATAPAPAPARPATPRTATLSQIRNAAARQEPAPAARSVVTSIREAGNGHQLDRVAQVDDLLVDRFFDLMGTQAEGNFRVATFQRDLPPDRKLADGKITDVDDMVEEIRAKYAKPAELAELTADGGICGPVEYLYDENTIGQAGRRLRSAIAQFQTRRGGIKFRTPRSLSSILSATTPTSGNAIGVISEAQDAAATYDKSVQRVTCPSEVEKRVDIVYRQLEFGVLMDRTNPEGSSAFTDLSLIAFARFNEQRLFNAMVSNSTPVFGAQKLGASRDLITTLNRHAINRRAQHRMDVNAQVDVVLPAWVGMGLLPDDQTNALQSYPEQFDVNAAWVEAKLRAKNINVLAWYEDDFTTAVASGGGVNNYPATFDALMFHPGAHVYVDGGGLDIGVYRDSTLIVNNLFRTFNEEFWTTAMWGVWSDRIRFSLCANGASAGSKAPTCGS